MNPYGTGRASSTKPAAITRPITTRRFSQWTNSIQTTPANPQPPFTPEMQKYGRRRIRVQKYLFQMSIIAAKSVYSCLPSAWGSCVINTGCQWFRYLRYLVVADALYPLLRFGISRRRHEYCHDTRNTGQPDIPLAIPRAQSYTSKCRKSRAFDSML